MSSQLSGASGKIVAIKCDVCNEEEIKSVFAAAKTQFGGIDVCINNAGLSHQTPILTGHTDHFKEILEVGIIPPYVYHMTILTSQSLYSNTSIRILQLAKDILSYCVYLTKKDFIHFYKTS